MRSALPGMRRGGRNGARLHAWRRFRRGVSATVVVVSAIGTWRCAPVSAPASPSPPRRNLLLVTLDPVRADHLGSYGDRGASTPALDRLAREGVRLAGGDWEKS